MVAGMKTLHPACDRLITTAAANDLAGMREIDEAVIQLVEECSVKLRTRITNCSKRALPVAQQGVPYSQIILSNLLLPPNTPDQWGPATTVDKPSQVHQNAQPGPASNAGSRTCLSWELPRFGGKHRGAQCKLHSSG